jgi:fructokinase
MDATLVDYYIGLETGGTNIKCYLARDPNHVISQLSIQTQDPQSTIDQVIHFIQAGIEKYKVNIAAMGIGSFGPVDLDPSSTTYGSITSTPKLAWRNFPLLDKFRSVFNFPIAFDTDVNAALLGEARWGAGIGFSDLVYVTVGTGIGGGILSNKQLVHGIVHTELGHMLVNHNLRQDPFEGSCPYHKNCLEGLAAGPAIQARWGIQAHKIPGDHQAWLLEAHYLAQMAVNLTVMLSPQRIILGGGICQQPGLIEMVRLRFKDLLNGYVQSQFYDEKIDSYIVAPMLGNNAGILGTIALARTLSIMEEQ